MKRWSAVLLICVALTWLLAACGTVNVTGTWSQADQTAKLVFEEDGSGTLLLDGESLHPFIYEVSDNTVTLTGEDGTFAYTCDVQGDQMTMTGSSGQSAALTREP